jgi:hypothetical protein
MSPSTKVSTGAVAGAVVVFVIWVVKAAGLVDDVPPEVAAAVTTVVSFVLAWLVPETNPAPSTYKFRDERMMK